MHLMNSCKRQAPERSSTSSRVVEISTRRAPARSSVASAASMRAKSQGAPFPGQLELQPLVGAPDLEHRLIVSVLLHVHPLSLGVRVEPGNDKGGRSICDYCFGWIRSRRGSGGRGRPHRRRRRQRAMPSQRSMLVNAGPTCTRSKTSGMRHDLRGTDILDRAEQGALHVQLAPDAVPCDSR